MRKRQVDEIFITRAIAILGVLMVHATSFPVSEYDTSSSVYGLYNFANTFFRFGTPTFIFLSSFVLFYSYFHRPFTKELIVGFYKKRGLYILLPYIVFSIIYYLSLLPVYSALMTEREMIVDFFKKLATGDVASHLYFVFISIQFYFLFPFLLVFFKKYPKLVKHTIWMGLALQWIFVLLNNQYLHLSNKGSISFSYVSYYFLGIYVGVYFYKVEAFLKSTRLGALTIVVWTAWLGVSLGHVYLWDWTRTTGGAVQALTYELMWNAHTLLSAIVVTQASFFIYQRLSMKLVNGLIHLGVVSFGVYLIHLLILNLYQRIIPTFGISFLYHAKSAGGFVISLGVSWAIVTLVTKYISNSWVLFGSTPKSVPFKSFDNSLDQ